MDTTIVVIVAAVAVVVGLGLLGWKVPKVRLYTWGAAGVVAAFAVAVLQLLRMAKRGEEKAGRREAVRESHHDHRAAQAAENERTDARNAAGRQAAAEASEDPGPNRSVPAADAEREARAQPPGAWNR